MYYYFILSIGIIFNVLAQVLLKIGMKSPLFLESNPGLILKLKEIVTNYRLVGSVLLYGLGFISYAVALKGIELSRAYPAASIIAIIFIFFISILFLGESVNFYKFIGIILSILGIIFIFFKG